MPSRRQFLRGKFSAHRASTDPAALAPPWAAEDFLTRCTRCADCTAACPTRIIVNGDGGYPYIDYTLGECTFCAACVEACTAGALARDADAAPWHRSVVIDIRCLAKNKVVCRSCAEACETNAINFQPTLGGVALPQVSDALCSGCGACVAICPSEAIQVGTRTTTPELSEFQRRVA